MAVKFNKFVGLDLSGQVVADESYTVVIEGTRVGELNRDGKDWWFEDYSEGDQTFFNCGMTLKRAKAATIKYLDSIGYEPGKEVEA